MCRPCRLFASPAPVFLLCCVGIAGVAGADRYLFSDGFESGNVTAWSSHTH